MLNSNTVLLYPHSGLFFTLLPSLSVTFQVTKVGKIVSLGSDKMSLRSPHSVYSTIFSFVLSPSQGFSSILFLSCFLRLMYVAGSLVHSIRTLGLIYPSLWYSFSEALVQSSSVFYKLLSSVVALKFRRT